MFFLSGNLILYIFEYAKIQAIQSYFEIVFELLTSDKVNIPQTRLSVKAFVKRF